MPNAQTVEQLLRSRLPRSLDAWRERLDLELADSGRTTNLAVVRLSAPTATAPVLRAADLERAQSALHVSVRRYLGGADYVVELTEYAHQNRLALEGHLDVTARSYRLTAI